MAGSHQQHSAEGIPIRLVSVIAVSYTHLDVYKRQAKFAFSMFWRAMRFAEEQQVPILLDY